VSETFDINPIGKPALPKLDGEVVLRADPDAAIDALLADLYLHANNCVRAFGDFHLAVGASPEVEPALRRLLYDPIYRDFPWARTRLWMAEEVAVAPEDARARWPRLRDTIVEQSGIPPEQAHRIEIEDPDACSRYAGTLREFLEWRPKGHDRLDFVLVGLGEGGEIGGLGGEALSSEDLVASWVNPSGHTVVSLTARFLSVSRCVAVLAAGGVCKPALARWVRKRGWSADGGECVPATEVRRWYVDHAACEGAGAVR
jgi:6-phosphogluconolactonase/glucosamine-6-phosphate isomerase/deaminase